MAKEVAEYFGVVKARRDTLIKQVRGAVSQWNTVAGNMGILRNEIAQMEPCFYHGAAIS